MAGCVSLMLDLPGDTWVRFLVCMALGLVVYAAYSARASRVGEACRASGGDRP